MRLPVLLLVAAGSALFPAAARADHIVGTSCGASVTCAGHQFWPRMTLADVQKADIGGSVLNGRRGNADELLGWHGSDTLNGHSRSDVLWGDHEGDGQPKKQRDRINGHGGDDYIYSSHGRSVIDAGDGWDAIKVRYGRGKLDCGPGRDFVYIPRSRKKRWDFTSCERFEYRTEAEVGHGLKTLRD